MPTRKKQQQRTTTCLIYFVAVCVVQFNYLHYWKIWKTRS